MPSNDDLKARAEAAFREAKRVRADAISECKPKQEPARDKMAKLRELRLAAEAKATSERKAKRKPGGKVKR